jgi:hypothetical protein
MLDQLVLVFTTVLNKGYSACSITRLRICELDWIAFGYGQVVAFLMTLWLKRIDEFLFELNTNSCSIELALTVGSCAGISRHSACWCNRLLTSRPVGVVSC